MFRTRANKNGSVFPAVLALALLLSACGRGGGDPDASASATGAASGPTISGQRISFARDMSTTTIAAHAADINDTGTAIAAWTEESSSSMSSDVVWANVYRNNAWGSAVQLGARGSVAPVVAVAASGNAIVAWTQAKLGSSNNKTGSAIYIRRYDFAANAWDTLATPISSDVVGVFADSASVASDASGNAVVIWTESDQVWGRYYIAASNRWEAALPLSSSPRLVTDPRVVSNGSGSFAAVWSEDSYAYDPGQTAGGPRAMTIYAQFRTATQWVGPKQRIGWPSAQVAATVDGLERIKIDANQNGNVVVVWEQTRTINATVQRSIDSAHYANGTWTTAPQTLASHSAYLSFPQVAIDNSGNAWALWQRTAALGSGISAVHAARLDPATRTWATDILLDETGTGSVSEAVLAMDGAGNAQANWLEAGTNLVQRRFTNASGWGAFTRLYPSADQLVLAASDAGQRVMLGHHADYSGVPFYVSAWGWINNP